MSRPMPSNALRRLMRPQCTAVASVPARAPWLLALLALFAFQDAPVEPATFREPTADPAPVFPFDPARLEGADALSCAECHAEIVDEWAGTAHALSWVDAEYQDALLYRKRPKSCHACHIPEPLLADGTLASRARARAGDHRLGVSCDVCHLGPDGAMLGPTGRASTAHASATSEFLTAPESSRACQVCHSTNIGPVLGVGKDFVDSGQEAAGRSCVGCHMRLVEREGPVLGLLLDSEKPGVRITRSHALQTPRDPAFLASAFGFGVLDGTHVQIVNRAGHRVPGMIGREIEFRFDVLGAQDVVLETVTETIDASRYLPVRGVRDVTWSAHGTTLHVVGHHRGPRSDETVIFLDVQLPLGG